jgi:hypothetical protein
LRSLYSKNIPNLLMAGRNMSCTHTAFTSTRVMATCAVAGQAAGTAAAQCVREKLTPRELYQNKRQFTRLQQALVRDDQTIRGVTNQDPDDLARQAKVTCSAEQCDGNAALVIDGHTRDYPPKLSETGPIEIHHWEAPLTPEGAWIELSWNRPQAIREIQITFDSGFQRELTLSKGVHIHQGMIRAPQPETVRDYEILVRTGGALKPLHKVNGNHQRLNRHRFDLVKADAIRIHVTKTNGDKFARIFEVRCYA